MAPPGNSTRQSFVRRFFHSRLFLIILLIVIALIALSYARAYYQDYTIRQEIRKLEEEVKNLEHKRLDSLQILEYVMSDAFVEEKARRELNLKKPGEHMAIITRPDGAETQASTSASNPEGGTAGQGLSNPLKWWYYFSHKEMK